MALRVIDGVPGSGKTFYAVRHLAKNYFKKDAETGVYELARDCIIITNIDDFKPDHVDLKKEIDIAGLAALARIDSSSGTDIQKERARDKIDPVAEFFSIEYQEKYKEGKLQIVYVIDEAQRFFRKGSDRALRERKVFDYFEYHRHWGQDIYLVTQNVKKLPPDIVYLPEYIISAQPRVRTAGFGFKYYWMSSGENIKTESCRPDKAVFALYKSMDKAEQEKIKNPMLKKIGLAFLFSLVVLFCGYKYFASKYQPDVSSTVSSSVPSVSPLGSSFIPIGEPQRPPEPRYIVFVPLSKVTLYAYNDEKSLYVWRGAFISAAKFPHKTVYMSGRRYAVLDYELFDFIFGDSEDRPKDFIVQVKPEPLPSDGSAAPERSPVERRERNRRSEKAERTKRG